MRFASATILTVVFLCAADLYLTNGKHVQNAQGMARSIAAGFGFR
jgi:hypothetical protein